MAEADELAQPALTVFSGMVPNPTQDVNLCLMPHPTFWNIFCFCLVCLGLLWLPMAVLLQIDALLMFMTQLELAADVAFLLVLLAVLSVALATVASSCGAMASRFGLGVASTRKLVWLFVLIPVGLACIWQFGFTIRRLLVPVLDIDVLPHRKLLFLAIIAVAAAWLWRSIGVTRVISVITTLVLELSAPTVLVTLVALVCVFWKGSTISMYAGSVRSAAPAPSGAPDIFLITMDSLAVEDASVFGVGPTNMPNFQQLAARSTYFTHHYVGSTLTNSSTTSLETSTLPWTHWVVHGGRPPAYVSDGSIAQMLRRAGYSTHAISAALGATPRRHGTDQAYDTTELARTNSLSVSATNAILEFPDLCSLPSLFDGVLNVLSAIDLELVETENPFPAENVFGPAGRLLALQRKDRPVFLWTHIFPPHAPYLPPVSTRYQLLPAGQFDHYRDFPSEMGRYGSARQTTVDKLRLRYQETVRGADESLGRFLQELERQGRLERALLIITSDHGESFERGVAGHGGPELHEAVIRVPLLIKLPGQTAGRTIDTPTSQVDIAPTILELAGAEPIPMSEGRSLASGLKGARLDQTPVISMALLRESRFRPLTGGHYAVIEGPMKLVYHMAEDKSELYNLTADPRENQDISTVQPAITMRLRGLLKAGIAAAEVQRRKQFGMH